MLATEDICDRLHNLVRMLPRFQFTQVDSTIPANGVYFIFEVGEFGHKGDRIVRIGSHTGTGNLANRLSEHVTLNKDRSIFRKNIGRALLNMKQDPFLRFWELDLTKKVERARHEHLVDKNLQQSVEEAVSKYVASNLSYAVVGAEQDALHLERKCIGTISRCTKCSASGEWLGRHSPKPKIRASGLWQVQHLHCEGLGESELVSVERGIWPPEKVASRSAI
jgi:hypothetical protein